MHVLVCYNKTPQTGQFINNKNIFVTVPEVGKPKIKGPTKLLSSLVTAGAFSLCLCMVEGAKDFSGPSF